MIFFEPRRSRETEELIGSDAATRALSVTVVENGQLAIDAVATTNAHAIQPFIAASLRNCRCASGVTPNAVQGIGEKLSERLP